MGVAIKPTPAMRQKVAVAAGAGMAQADIAASLDMGVIALRKYFRSELKTGASKCRMEIVNAVYAKAKKGNVGAAKAYASMFTPLPSASASPGQSAHPALLGSDTPAARGQLFLGGKKERQNAEAATAHVGTEWEDLVPRSRSESEAIQ